MPPPPVLPNASIAEHPEYNNPQAGDFLLILDSTTGVTKKIDASYFLASSPSTNYQWLSNIDYPVDEIVEYQGKWYKSLDNPNEGNVPSAPGSLFWVEVNKSASGFVPYVPGVFTSAEVYVIGDLDGLKQLFRLVNATRPYNSANLINEYAAGDWELMSERGFAGISKAAHGFAVNDVLTFKNPGSGFAWVKYTTGDKPLAIVRNVVSANLVVVVLLGNRSKNFVGLTTGSIYFAQSDATISTTPSDDAILMAISATEAIIFAGGGSSSGGDFWPLSGTATLTGTTIIDADGNAVLIGTPAGGTGGAINVFGPQASIIGLDAGALVSAFSANEDGTTEIVSTSHTAINGDPGSSGQVPISQGSGLPIVWGTIQTPFRGYYASLAALQSAIPSGNDGDYAYVDTGIGSNAQVYIWDTDDDDWVAGGLTTIPDASETVKGVVEEAATGEMPNDTGGGGTLNGGTGARLFVGPTKLGAYITAFLAAAHTWALQQIFTLAPRFSSVTASQFLKVDGSKDLTSVGSASQATMITGTDDTQPATALSIESKRSIKLKSFSNAATGSSTIDCLGAQEVTVFYNTTVTGGITIALSNDSNLETLNVIIPITGVNIQITTPSTTRGLTYLEVTAGDGWYQSTKIMQVSSVNAADTHELSFKRASAGPTFNLAYDGPYRA